MAKILIPITSFEEFGDVYYRQYHPEKLREWLAWKKRKARRIRQEMAQIEEEERAAAGETEAPKEKARPKKWPRNKFFDKDQLRQWYEVENLSIEEIADKTKKTPDQVKNALRKYKLHRPTKPEPQEPDLPDEELRHLYVDLDWTATRLAKKYGTTYYRMSTYLRRHRILKDKQNRYDEDEVRRLWEDGVSVAEIARRYGVTRGAIEAYMARCHIKEV